MLFIPERIIQLCFSDRDLDRLSECYDVIRPGAKDEINLMEAWSQYASRTDVLITGWDTPIVTPSMLDRAPQLQMIMHAAGSVKYLLPIDVWERGIRVANVNDALARGVAETTLGLIIAGLKGFFPCHQLTRAGGWKHGDIGLPFPIRELYEVTIGLIGVGKVARHLIRLLRQFEVNVLVADPTLNPMQAEEYGVTLMELDDLLRRSDVVSLHAPPLPETYKLLGAPQFQLLKDNAIFINTARGALVDEDALVDEMSRRPIWALLDVFDPEPPAKDHPLRMLPRSVMLPHIAGAVSNGCHRQGRSAVDQMLAFAENGPLSGLVTAEMLPIVA